MVSQNKVSQINSGCPKEQFKGCVTRVLNPTVTSVTKCKNNPTVIHQEIKSKGDIRVHPILFEIN